jgi:8-oxo-dGTP diphosphatase
MENGSEYYTFSVNNSEIWLSNLSFRLICNSATGLLQLTLMKIEQLPVMRYTLCFLTRTCARSGSLQVGGEEVLMLHRRYPPNQGLWNGVGGRLEPGESPRECILREVREETGYHIPNAVFRGVLTWEGFETPPGGLYIFTATAPEGQPQECSEGELEWKPREWIFTAPEAVSNIAIFGPFVLGIAPAQEYHFTYRDGKIVHYKILPLPNGWNLE